MLFWPDNRRTISMQVKGVNIAEAIITQVAWLPLIASGRRTSDYGTVTELLLQALCRQGKYDPR